MIIWFADSQSIDFSSPGKLSLYNRRKNEKHSKYNISFSKFYDSVKSLLTSRNNSKSSYEIEDCNFYFQGYPSQLGSDKNNQTLRLT